MRNPPPKPPVQKPPLPKRKKIGRCVPNEEQRRERQGKEAKGKEKIIKKIVGKVEGREAREKRGWIEMQGCLVFFKVFFTKREEINQS